MSLLSVFLGREICGMQDWDGCDHFGQYDAVMNSDDVEAFVDKNAEEFLKEELKLFPGFRAISVPGDGNCLSHAVSKSCCGVELLYHALRKELQAELREHKEWYWKKCIPFFDEESATEHIESAAIEAVPQESNDNDAFGFSGCQGMAAFLGPIHIHALANILRRPIVLMSSREKWEQSLAGVYLPERRPPGEWTAEVQRSVLESANAVTQDPLFESSALKKPFRVWLERIGKLLDPIDLSSGDMELKMRQSEVIGALCDELSEVLRVCVLPAGEVEAKTSKEFIATFTPGPLGLKDDSKTGVILEVDEGSQAQLAGVQRGWRLKAVNNQACRSFDDKAFQDAQDISKSTVSYRVTFDKAFDVGTRVQAAEDILVDSTVVVKAGTGGRVLSPGEECKKDGSYLVRWDRTEEGGDVDGHIRKAVATSVEREASIEGTWNGGFIVGKMLRFNDGSEERIDILSAKKFTITLSGTLVTALLGDDGKLHWDDGDIWERLNKVTGASDLGRSAWMVHQAINSVRLRSPIFISWSSPALAHFVCLMPSTPGGRLSTRKVVIPREALPQRDGEITILGEPEEGLSREESCKMYLEGGEFAAYGNQWPNREKFLEKVEAVWRKDHPREVFQEEVLVKGWNILLPNILSNVLDIAQLFKTLDSEDDDDPVWLQVGMSGTRLLVPRRIERVARRLPQLENLLSQAAERMRPIWVTSPDSKSVLRPGEECTIEWGSLPKISSLVEKFSGKKLEEQMVEIGWFYAGQNSFQPNIAQSVPFHTRKHVWKVPDNFEPGRYWLAVRVIPFRPPCEFEGAGPPQGSFLVRARVKALEFKFFKLTDVAVRNTFATAVQLSQISLRRNGVPISMSAAKITNPGGHSPPGDGPENCIDGGNNTKWLDFNKQGLLIEFPSIVEADAFTFTTGNDCPERDPVSWRIEVSKDGESWTKLLKQRSDTTTRRHVETDEFQLIESLHITAPLMGDWWYDSGRLGGSSYSIYAEDEELVFEERNSGKGILVQTGEWWVADTNVGAIRIRHNQDGTLSSQYMPTATRNWHAVVTAYKAEDLLNDAGEVTSIFKQCLEELFRRFDVDGDNVLCTSELQAYHRAADRGQYTDKELDDMSQWYDWEVVSENVSGLTMRGWIDMWKEQAKGGTDKEKETWSDLRNLGYGRNLKKIASRRASLSGLNLNDLSALRSSSVSPNTDEAVEYDIILDKRDKGSHIGVQFSRDYSITRIKDGLVSQWNEVACLDAQVCIGDRIIEVNGKTALKDMIEECDQNQLLEIKLRREASEYSLGERVECSDDGQSWEQGTVTSLCPLKVSKNGTTTSQEWWFVRKIKQVFKVGDRVEMRDRDGFQAHSFYKGIVTSVDPLLVTQEKRPYDKGFAWDEVRHLQAEAVEEKEDKTTWEYCTYGYWRPMSILHADVPGHLDKAREDGRNSITLKIGSGYLMESYYFDLEQMKVQIGAKTFAIRRNGKFEVYQPSLTQLLEFGFGEAAARKALEHCCNDVEMAINYMVDNPDDPEPDVDAEVVDSKAEEKGDLDDLWTAPVAGDTYSTDSGMPRMHRRNAWGVWGLEDLDDDLYGSPINKQEGVGSDTEMDVLSTLTKAAEALTPESAGATLKEIGVAIPQRELTPKSSGSVSNMPTIDEEYLATMEREAKTWSLKGEQMWQKVEEQIQEELRNADEKALVQPTLQRATTGQHATSSSKPAEEDLLAPKLSRTTSAPPVLMSSLSRHQWATLFHQARNLYKTGK